MHWELLDLAVGERQNRQRSLRDDDEAGSFGVHLNGTSDYPSHAFSTTSYLLESGELKADLLSVGLAPPVELGIGKRLLNVCEENVHIRQHFVEAVGEELRNERRSEVHHEVLVVLHRVVGHSEDGIRADGEEESLNPSITACRSSRLYGYVEELGLLYLSCVLRHVQMVDGERVRSGKVCTQRPMMLMDQRSTGAGLDLVVDLVEYVDA